MENGVGSAKEENLLSRMALNDNKAGMEGLDRDKINRIIMEASKGSRFYENELKKEQQVNQRIEKMMQQKARLTEQQLQRAQAQVEKMASELERSRDLSRVIVHVDMDAFYAAVEMRDSPELKDKPMAVGSMSMLSTSNYHARKYGVRAAMPGFIAKKLCPGLVIVPLNFDKYRAVSEEIREIFAEYDPNFQPMSLDEAYLDFTDHLEQRQSWPESLRTHRCRSRSNTPGMTLFHNITQEIYVEGADLSPVLFEDSLSSSGGDAGGPSELFGTSVEEAVREMRFRIEQRTTLTASAGIAPNMMLAKVCSDKNKPNGQYRLPPTREAVMDFTQKLPVRKVCGIGKVSEKMLNALGITTCSDLSQRMALLSLLFSETSWHHFLQISLGLSSTHIPRHEERKSMSTERTFKELSKPEEQFSLCRELCEDLADDLKKEALKGKTVTLKLKNVNFEVKTRAQTLPYAVATVEDIFAVAKDLLKLEIESESPQPLRLRLMGVRISAFVSSDDKTPMQKSIISFLQPGKAGCGRSSQILHQMPEGGDVRGHSIQSSQLTHDPPVQNGQKQNKVCWRSKQGRSGEEPPQQSFFQRAHAKRLQLQAERSSPQAEGAGEDLPVITSSNGAESSQPANTHDPTVQDLSEDEPTSPVERHASPSGCRALTESLTCPVCFRNVDTADLDAFNRHIDSCLSEAAAREDDLSDAESDLDPEPDRLQSGAVPKRGRRRAVEKEASCGGSPREGQETSRSDSASLIRADRQPAAQQRRSPHGNSPVLTCPVCQRTQDTDDLAVFNHHVDLCLNQEVLHELRGQAAFSGEAPAVKHGCDVDAGRPLPRQASKGKSKRRDTPSSPPSKKAKSLGPSNTIDKFFR
ncbi:DNA polymerase kappa [Fundulus diaphanus]